MDHLEAIRAYVAAVIEAAEGFEERVVGAARDKEAQGYRIVEGGQTGPHVDGLAPWELTDWRTGETVAGGSGLESFQSAFEAENWWHIDSLTHGLAPVVPEASGLPAGLVRALSLWAASDPVGAEEWLDESAQGD